MGLLDEAIRDHLELKRRRGADPTEIAREEHEVLAPIFPEESSSSEAPPADAPAEVLPGQIEGDYAGIGQETVELDMQAVLDEEMPPAGDPGREAPAEDSLEWEMPGRQEAEPPPQQLPGQERLTFE